MKSNKLSIKTRMHVAKPIINPTKSLNNVDPKITTNITPNPHIIGVVKKLISLNKSSNFDLLFLIFGRISE